MEEEAIIKLRMYDIMVLMYLFKPLDNDLKCLKHSLYIISIGLSKYNLYKRVEQLLIVNECLGCLDQRIRVKV